MKVRSIDDEIAKRGWALLKGLAAEGKTLPELFCESDLAEACEEGKTLAIDMDFLKGCRAARVFANGLLEEASVTAESCTAVLETKVAQLLAMDPHFTVEIAFFRCVTGESADKRVYTMILNCMPAAVGDVKTPKQCQALVAELRSKKIMQFCTAAGRAAHVTAVEMLAALSLDKRPQLPQAGCAGAFVQNLNKSLAFFVRAEEITVSRPAQCIFQGAQCRLYLRGRLWYDFCAEVLLMICLFM